MKRRTTLLKTKSLFGRTGNRCQNLKFLEQDLFDLAENNFDYIICSNVLHHSKEPAQLLKHLASLLNDNGVMRVVTYPKASRIWMRKTNDWLLNHDISVHTKLLKKKARETIKQLPIDHPVRTTFEIHPERRSKTGLIDAFLNARENPLSPLEWAKAAEDARLVLVGEGQNEMSRSSFLLELLPSARKLDNWQRLQVLDDLLELCSNPILFFKKCKASPQPPIQSANSFSQPNTQTYDPSLLTPALSASDFFTAISNTKNYQTSLPSEIGYELGQNLKRVEQILVSADSSVFEVIAALKKHVGRRWSPPPKERELEGLSIIDYDPSTLLKIPQPWGSKDWQELEQLFRNQNRTAVLEKEGKKLPGKSLAEQAKLLQIKEGPYTDLIRDLSVRART
ncbi:MAG: hypothetical protein A3K03_10680 [Bdellovibrionales bacterium RIFOXYD1_FULL_44_7]|nr:MAG: hypothetical protein A3K03_10680 [Bdellovibrionales bacterium RIFOXYD1_FULL_44_7]